MSTCRLIVDPPTEGAWNMALDEALLNAAEQEHVATLRFYSWREPTLSLGYFQAHAQRRWHAASAGCALVRRASGGGAIVHDRELTYSIALPGAHHLARRSEKLYRAVHQSLMETLAEFGVEATLCQGSTEHRIRPADEPFLCFQRRVAGDVLIGPHKVAGSAQRRHRGAVLQHGSVLLARSQFAPELPGIANQHGDVVEFDRLRELWQPRLAQRLGMTMLETPLSAGMLAAAGEIVERKFAAGDWTYRR